MRKKGKGNTLELIREHSQETPRNSGSDEQAKPWGNSQGIKGDRKRGKKEGRTWRVCWETR